MATFLLIRHAAHSHLGRTLTGRMLDVTLSEEGRQQAQRLADQLGQVPLSAVWSSPRERTRETARAVAERHRLPVEISEDLDEIDFGDWTGQTFEELRSQSHWQWFNSYRSGTRVPGGELMPEAQLRIVRTLERLRGEVPDGMMAIISHGDVIKAAVAYYLGVPLDLFQRIEISPASVSVIELQNWGPRVLTINHTLGPLPLPR